MRNVLAVVLAVLAVLALGSPALAQAPTSKVTIVGLVDNVSSYTRNLSLTDLNYSRKQDTEWYARTRVRPDIIGEVGTSKFVLGLEIDAIWGQLGATDNTPVRASTGSWDLNTDVVPQIEIKWAYTEFDMPGIPVPTRVRLGAQPFGAAANYKVIYANGDFAGVNINSALTPQVRLLATWAQLEEESTGRADGFTRGEDHAFIFSTEITPFKGLDLKPMYSWFVAEGATNGASRASRGGLAAGTVSKESRHTIGLDARWRMGPFSLDPTFLFQFGERNLGKGREQDKRAWILDVRGGFQVGPLLLELAGIWTPGNSANEDVRQPGTDAKYFEPLSTDTGYYSTWAEHWALGIDYFNILQFGGTNPGVGIGYDKYGLIRFGGRASYAVTPAFTVRGAVTANWADEKVDTDGSKTAAAGITPGDFRGDERYLGTEVDLGFTWRFAPGITFDLVGAQTWLGDAMANRTTTGVVPNTRPDNSPKGVQTATIRLRYNF